MRIGIDIGGSHIAVGLVKKTLQSKVVLLVKEFNIFLLTRGVSFCFAVEITPPSVSKGEKTTEDAYTQAKSFESLVLRYSAT